MFMASKSGSRRRQEAVVARENACIAAGCKCYCHVPVKDWSRKKSILFALMFGGFWFGICYLLVSIRQYDNAKHPPEPYYCTSITSTGAPSDCHPAVLPPDVLKKYEDQFK